jgi:hypothetical protein
MQRQHDAERIVGEENLENQPEFFAQLCPNCLYLI